MAASVATADSVPSKSLEGPRLGLPAPAPIEIVFPAPPQALAPVSAGEILELHVRVIEGRGLRRAHALVRNEPFVTLRCRDELTRSAAVRCDDGEGSAVFDFKSMVHALVEDNVAIAVVHHGGLMSGEAVLGDVVFAVCDLIDGLVAERWLVLHHEGQAAGELHVRMQLMHGGERHIDAPPAAAASAATLSAPDADSDADADADADSDAGPRLQSLLRRDAAAGLHAADGAPGLVDEPYARARHAAAAARRAAVPCAAPLLTIGVGARAARPQRLHNVCSGGARCLRWQRYGSRLYVDRV